MCVRLTVFVFRADFTVLTVRLTQRAVAGNPLSQIMFPDHTELPLQVKDLLRLNHLHTSGMSHVRLPALVFKMFYHNSGGGTCKHSR